MLIASHLQETILYNTNTICWERLITIFAILFDQFTFKLPILILRKLKFHVDFDCLFLTGFSTKFIDMIEFEYRFLEWLSRTPH